MGRCQHGGHTEHFRLQAGQAHRDAEGWPLTWAPPGSSTQDALLFFPETQSLMNKAGQRVAALYPVPMSITLSPSRAHFTNYHHPHTGLMSHQTAVSVGTSLRLIRLCVCSNELSTQKTAQAQPNVRVNEQTSRQGNHISQAQHTTCQLHP